MSRRDKLIEKMRDTPGAIRYAQVDALLRHMGFTLFNKRGSHRTYHCADGRLFTIWFHTVHVTHATPTTFENFWSYLNVITIRHEYRGYVFTITYKAQDPAFSVDFPDFPAIITSDATLTGAFGHACEALDLHLESMQKLNMPLPRPKRRLVLETE